MTFCHGHGDLQLPMHAEKQNSLLVLQKIRVCEILTKLSNHIGACIAVIGRQGFSCTRLLQPMTYWRYSCLEKDKEPVLSPAEEDQRFCHDCLDLSKKVLALLVCLESFCFSFPRLPMHHSTRVVHCSTLDCSRASGRNNCSEMLS